MKEALSDLLTFRLLEIILSEPKNEPQSFFEGSLKHFTSFCFFEVPGSLAFIILKGHLSSDLKGPEQPFSIIVRPRSQTQAQYLHGWLPCSTRLLCVCLACKTSSCRVRPAVYIYSCLRMSLCYTRIAMTEQTRNCHFPTVSIRGCAIF